MCNDTDWAKHTGAIFYKKNNDKWSNINVVVKTDNYRNNYTSNYNYVVTRTYKPQPFYLGKRHNITLDIIIINYYDHFDHGRDNLV